MTKTEYGLQMYSVRDSVKDGMKDTLQQVAEMGYKYVEFAGFFGYPAADIKAWLDEFGLICSGTHTGVGYLTDETMEETIRYHKTIGCTNLIIPGMDWSTEEKMEENIALLNKAQKILAENGITLGYHNHSREFMVTDYGKVIEDEIIARTKVALEIDTFWAFNAGLNPVEYCESLKDRIRVIHLKDGIPTDAANRNYEHVHDNVKGLSVGSGSAPVNAVRAWAMANKVRMVIESEGLDPTGLEEVKRCMYYLSSLE